MPANLTPEYLEAEERWRKANNPEDKLAALEEMFRALPKHKGTEKMQADLKKRMAKVRDQIESSQESKGAKRTPEWVVEKQGCGQIVVIGPANCGKSAFISDLTTADPEIGEYPFTTALPEPAMMKYENVQIQMIDTPPLHREMSPSWLGEAIRPADAVLLMLDLSDDDVLDLTEAGFAYLQQRKMDLHKPAHLKSVDECIGTEGERNAEIMESYPALVVAHKFEDDEAELRLDLLRQIWEDSGYPKLPIIRTSCSEELNLDRMPGVVWELLGKVRVYTRPPGHDPDYSAPFVLDKGSTALDLAYTIHKDIGASFKYAKVWGDNTFDAQKVGRDYVLTDGDVLEVHSDE